MKYSTRLPIIFILFSLLVLTACTEKSENDLPSMFHEYTFKTDDLPNSKFFEYQHGDERLVIKQKEDVDVDKGMQLVTEQAKLFESIFEPKRVSYPGPTTQNIICPDEFKPKKFEEHVDGKLIYFEGYANSNYVAGACSLDLIKKSMVLALMYCEKTRMFLEINYYVDAFNNSSIEDFAKRLSCD